MNFIRNWIAFLPLNELVFKVHRIKIRNMVYGIFVLNNWKRFDSKVKDLFIHSAEVQASVKVLYSYLRKKSHKRIEVLLSLYKPFLPACPCSRDLLGKGSYQLFRTKTISNSFLLSYLSPIQQMQIENAQKNGSRNLRSTQLCNSDENLRGEFSLLCIHWTYCWICWFLDSRLSFQSQS